MAFTDASPRVILDAAGPLKVTLTVACKRGDVISYHSGWEPADDASRSILVAGEDGAALEEITAYMAAVIGGASGCTPGAVLHLAGSGAVDEAAGGDRHVGLVLSATSYYIGPKLTPY
jgi:hypothetical protein